MFGRTPSPRRRSASTPDRRRHDGSRRHRVRRRIAHRRHGDRQRHGGRRQAGHAGGQRAGAGRRPHRGDARRDQRHGQRPGRRAATTSSCSRRRASPATCRYRTLEMHVGAVIDGRLEHVQAEPGSASVVELKRAARNPLNGPVSPSSGSDLTGIRHVNSIIGASEPPRLREQQSNECNDRSEDAAQPADRRCPPRWSSPTRPRRRFAR